jgi:hypothetical protein
MEEEGSLTKVVLSHSKHTGKIRDRGNYWKERRAGIALSQGRIPYRNGNPFYLSEEEEEEFVSTIRNWDNPITYPTVAKVAELV